MPRFTVVHCAFLSCVLSMFACGDDEEIAGCDPELEPLVVGAVLPFTGNTPTGELWSVSAQLATDMANQRGLAGGRCLEVRTRDSQSSAAVAGQEARAFLEGGEVLALVMATSADAAAVVGPGGLYTEDSPSFDRVPVLCIACTAPDFDLLNLTDSLPLAGASPLWRMTENNAPQGTALAEELTQAGDTTAATYAIDVPFGVQLINAFETRFSELGGTIDSADQRVHAPALNPIGSEADGAVVATDLEALLEAPNPDALVVNSLPGINQAVIEEWERLGAPGSIYLSFTAVFGSILDVARVQTATLDRLQGISYAYAAGTGGEQFAAAFSEATNRQVLIFADHYYDAIVMAALAIGATNDRSPTPLAVQENLQRLVDTNAPEIGYGLDAFTRGVERLVSGETINYEGVSGPLDHDLAAQNGVTSELARFRVDNGEIVLDPLSP